MLLDLARHRAPRLERTTGAVDQNEDGLAGTGRRVFQDAAADAGLLLQLGDSRSTVLSDQLRCQNAGSRARSSKITSASSAVGRRQSGSSLFSYHACASAVACSMARTANAGGFVFLRHSSACSSDRKRWMVDQVKSMSFQKSRAGTPTCMTVQVWIVGAAVRVDLDDELLAAVGAVASRRRPSRRGRPGCRARPRRRSRTRHDPPAVTKKSVGSDAERVIGVDLVRVLARDEDAALDHAREGGVHGARRPSPCPLRQPRWWGSFRGS